MARAKLQRVVSSPPRSLYRKVQLVIDEARKEETNSLEDLVEHISKRGHLDFTYFKVSSVGPAKLAPSRLESIRKVVNMCVTLGLVDGENGRLTSRGLKAADSLDQFNYELRKSINSKLKQMDAPFDEIQKSIIDLLINHKGKVLPTWDIIYQKLEISSEQCRKKDFNTYLNLLSACNGINYSRKKIYLP